MTKIDISHNLTKPEGEQKFSMYAATHAGMAHFAGTGPRGETCRSCQHWAHEDWYSNNGKHGGAPKDAACRRYRQMTGIAGAKVPHTAMACNRFEPREGGPVPLRRPERAA